MTIKRTCFFLNLLLQTLLEASATKIAAMPKATAKVAMLIIRAETLFLCCFNPCILRAKNNATFNEKRF